MRRVAPWTVLVCLLLVPPRVIAQGDERAEAKRHFEAGKTLFANEDYTAAAAEFEASTVLYPTQNGYYNLANCRLALHQYSAALNTLVTLNERFTDTMSRRMKEKVRDAKTTIRMITGELALDIVPEGSRVSLNGQERPDLTVGAPVVLAPGTYRLDVEHPGYRPREFSVTILSQKRREIEVALEPAPLPPAPPITAPVKPDASDILSIASTQTGVDLNPYFWASTAGAATTGLAAIVFFGLAAHQKSEANAVASDWQTTYPSSSEEAAAEQEFEDVASTFQTYRNVAIGLTISSALFAAGAFFLKYNSTKRSSAEKLNSIDMSLRPGGLDVRF